MDRYPSDATIRSVSVCITHKIIEDVALLALWGGNEMERKNKKSGKSANVWIHNLGLGGSLLCPVFQWTLSSKIWKKYSFDSCVIFHYRKRNDTLPSPLISVNAFRTSNTRSHDTHKIRVFYRSALIVSDMKRQETAGWGTEKLPVWAGKKKP